MGSFHRRGGRRGSRPGNDGGLGPVHPYGGRHVALAEERFHPLPRLEIGSTLLDEKTRAKMPIIRSRLLYRPLREHFPALSGLNSAKNQTIDFLHLRPSTPNEHTSTVRSSPKRQFGHQASGRERSGPGASLLKAVAVGAASSRCQPSREDRA